MKTENPNEPDPTLEQTLRSWVVTDTLPPRFPERVWHRIACQEAQIPTSLRSQVAAWINRTLARPSLAVGYVTLLLLTGLVAGYWQARVERAHTLEQLGSKYVQRVDPYQTRR